MNKLGDLLSNKINYRLRDQLTDQCGCRLTDQIKIELLYQRLKQSHDQFHHELLDQFYFL